MTTDTTITSSDAAEAVSAPLDLLLTDAAFGALSRLNPGGSGRSEQEQPHGWVSPGGMTMSRFWIFPVGPLGSASTIHTCRGYL